MIPTHARMATGHHWNWTLLATLGFCVAFWVGAFGLVAALL